MTITITTHISGSLRQAAERLVEHLGRVYADRDLSTDSAPRLVAALYCGDRGGVIDAAQVPAIVARGTLHLMVVAGEEIAELTAHYSRGYGPAPRDLPNPSGAKPPEWEIAVNGRDWHPIRDYHSLPYRGFLASDIWHSAPPRIRSAIRAAGAIL